MSVNDFINAYNDGKVKEPELDEYFLHDRGVRESGHDTTYRLEGVCADLATIDLNSLLFAIEYLVGTAIHQHLDDRLELVEEFAIQPFPFGSELPVGDEVKSRGVDFALTSQPRTSTKTVQTSAEWFARCTRRRELLDHYMWNEGKGLYFDYNTKTKSNPPYESVTATWALWAGAASTAQAQRLVSVGLPKFEVAGGLVPGTEQSRGPISLDRPNRQWDYPCVFTHAVSDAGQDRLGAASMSRVERTAALRFRGRSPSSGVQVVLHAHDRFCRSQRYHTREIRRRSSLARRSSRVRQSGHRIPHGPSRRLRAFDSINRLTVQGWTNASFEVGIALLSSHAGLWRSLSLLSPPDVVFR